MANYLSQPRQGIALNSWLLAQCSKSYPCPGGSWKMQEFWQQQLCWSRAVANAALLTLPMCFFFSCNETSHSQELFLPKVSPTSGPGDILNGKHRTSTKLSVKQEGTHHGRRGCKTTLWEYEDPQDASKEKSLPIFDLCGHHYPTDKNLHWICGWMIPAKHLYLVQKGILNYSTCALQFWDGLRRARKFIAFSRDILCEYRVLEFHKGCFREAEAPSIL